MIKTAKKIYSIISTLLIIIVVVAAFLLAGVRLFGLVPYTVLSGSMEPKYHVGSLIYVSQVDVADVEVGDPLTFRIANGAIVTHEVIKIIEADDPSSRQFITQGIANNTPDGAPVHASAVIGRPVFSIPYLGYVSNYVQNPPGTYVVICFVFAVLLLSFVPDILGQITKKAESSEESEEAEENDKNDIK